MYGTSSTGVASVGQSLQGPVQVKPPSEIDQEMQRLNQTIEHLHNRINLLNGNLATILDTSSGGGQEDSPEEVGTSSKLASGIRSSSNGVSSAIQKVDDIINRLRL